MRVQRIRALYMRFLEIRVVLVWRDVQALVRDHMAGIERILIRLAQRHELVITLAVGKIEAGAPPHRGKRDVARSLQWLREGPQFAARRRAIEAADPDV